MAQVSEPRTSSSSASPNIQDAFLNYARRDRLSVTIHLMDGRQFDARIKNFDKFAVVVEVDGADQLVFKHAIATIETTRAVANYFAAQHS
ncbi:MAG TPA: RNA chaperone Hfq [Vicinamibacterales bacterium]|nr:RNA chaperone Hfq [Vicinamibacterales bacterium]